MAKRITPRDLFEEGLYNKNSVLVVKNLPECCISQDGIENYIEWVTRRCLQSYCTAIDLGRNNTMVAVFDSDIEDLSQIRDKPFEGRRVHFEHLGDVGGIVVFDAATEIHDTLEGYFNNHVLSGGKEDCVQNVEFHQIEKRWLAVVTIRDGEAIANILSKPEHIIGSQTFAIEPYFPVFHDQIVQYCKQSEGNTNGQHGNVFIKTDTELVGMDVNTSPATQSLEEHRYVNVIEEYQAADDDYLQKAEGVETIKIINIAPYADQICTPSEHEHVSPIKETSSHKEEPEKIIASLEKDFGNLRLLDDTEEESSVTAEESSNDSAADDRFERLDYKEDVHKPEHQLIDFDKDIEYGIIRFSKSGFAMEENLQIDMNELSHQTRSTFVNISPKERADYIARSSIQEFLKKQAEAKNIDVIYDMNMNRMKLVCYANTEAMLDKGKAMVNEAFTTETVVLREGQKQCLSSKEWLGCQARNGTDLVVMYETRDSIVIEAVCTTKREVIQAIRRDVIEFLKACSPEEKAEIEIHGGDAEYFQKYIERDLEDRLRYKDVKLFTKKIKDDCPVRLLVTVEGQRKFLDPVKKEIMGIWHEQIDFNKIASEEKDILLIVRGLDGISGKEFFRHFQRDHKCLVQVLKHGKLNAPQVRIRQNIQEREVLASKTDSPNRGHGDASNRGQLVIPSIQIDSESEDTNDVFKQTAGSCAPSYENIENIDDVFIDTEENAVVGAKRMDKLTQSKTNYYLEYQDTRMSEDDALAIALTISLEAKQEKNTREPVNDQRANTNEETVKEIKIGKTKVILVRGQINTHTADALVNVVDPSGAFPGLSSVSKAFLQTAGSELARMYDIQFNEVIRSLGRDPSEPYSCSIITESAGNLHCRHVIHIKLIKDAPQVLPKVVRGLYQACNKNGYTTIAMPPLGVGRLHQYPVHEVASLMLSETVSFFQQAATNRFNAVREVRIVVYEKDKETCDAFERVFNQYNNPYASKEPVSGMGNIDHRPPVMSRPLQQQGPMSIVKQRNLVKDIVSKLPSTLVSLMNRLTNDEPDSQGYVVSVGNSNVQQHRSPDANARHTKSRTYRQNNEADNHYNEDIRHSPALPRRYARRDKGQERHLRQEVVYSRSRSEGRLSVDDDVRENQRRSDSRVTEGGYGEEMARRSNSNERPYQEVDTLTSETKYKKKDTQQSRFQEDAPRMAITVFARNRDECDEAKTALETKIRDEFLCSIDLVKRPRVSAEAKQKCAKVIERNEVTTIDVNGTYRIRGYKENVHKANEEILKILLEDRPIDTHSDKTRQRSKYTGARATLDFSKFMAREEVVVPRYWKNFKPGKILKDILIELTPWLRNTKFKKETLSSKDHAYSVIIRLINETFHLDSDKIGQGKDALGIRPYHQVFVRQICRIENPELYGQYAAKRSELFGRLFKKDSGYFSKLDRVKGGEKQPMTASIVENNQLGTDMYAEVNECFVFHGTKRENIDKICSDGLEARLCSPDAMFGQGIYGAETVVKADQYTDSKTSRSGGMKKMFLMRMLLGDIFVCSDTNPYKYKRAPCTSCYMDNCVDTKHHYGFDSVVGGMNKLFREFVVYDGKQCYPEYLITYERK